MTALVLGRVSSGGTSFWDASHYQGTYNGTRSGSEGAIRERVVLLDARKRDAFRFRDLLF